MKRLANFLGILALASAFLLTPISKAQGSYTAASCNLSDVNTLINGPKHTAVNGDTINIPAGSCTWTGSVSVPVGIGITIIGAGVPNSGGDAVGASTPQTIITDAASSTMFVMRPTVGASTSRISMMQLRPKLPYSAGNNSPISIVGTCSASGCPSARIDNLTAFSEWVGIGISDNTFAVVANMFGVADHNTIGDVAAGNGLDFVNVGHGNWAGVGSWGDNSWASPDSIGTNQAFYLENNVFNYAFGTDADQYTVAFGGARLVCRFNTFNNVTSAGACTNHGTDTIGRVRGGRQMEVYGNSVQSCQGGACNVITGSRSGTAIVFGNYFSGQFINSFIGVDTKRRWAMDSPWGPCDGSSAWDTNDGTTYYSGTIGSTTTNVNAPYVVTDSGSPGWTTSQMVVSGAPFSFHDVTKGWGYEIGGNTSNTFTTYSTGGSSGNGPPSAGDNYQFLRASVCMDQPARGQSLLVQGGDGTASTDGLLHPQLKTTGKPGAVTNAPDPIYEFADSGKPNHTMFSSDSQGLVANRDYFVENIGQTAQTSPSSPFNGTSGTGHGSLADRPSTCTTNVGYFATDQGSWNSSGNTFPNQSFSQGQLYICTSTNSWTLSYTPYAYPHPLVSGGGTGTGGSAINPPTSLSAIVQ